MSITDYKNDKERLDAKMAAEELERNNRAIFQQILEKHELLASHEGNFRMLVEYAGGTLTLGAVEFLLGNPPQNFTLQFTDEREKWLDAICELLEDPRERRMTAWDLKQERARMSFWTRSQLKARYDNLVEKRRLSKLSAGELKAQLANQRQQEKAANEWNGYPRLLSTIVPKYPVPERGWDTIRSVPTGDYIKHIARFDAALLKNFCRLYSSEQINFWLNQK